MRKRGNVCPYPKTPVIEKLAKQTGLNPVVVAAYVGKGIEQGRWNSVEEVDSEKINAYKEFLQEQQKRIQQDEIQDRTYRTANGQVMYHKKSIPSRKLNGNVSFQDIQNGTLTAELVWFKEGNDPTKHGSTVEYYGKLKVGDLVRFNHNKSEDAVNTPVVEVTAPLTQVTLENADDLLTKAGKEQKSITAIKMQIKNGAKVYAFQYKYSRQGKAEDVAKKGLQASVSFDIDSQEKVQQQNTEENTSQQSKTYVPIKIQRPTTSFQINPEVVNTPLYKLFRSHTPVELHTRRQWLVKTLESLIEYEFDEVLENAEEDSPYFNENGFDLFVKNTRGLFTKVLSSMRDNIKSEVETLEKQLENVSESEKPFIQHKIESYNKVLDNYPAFISLIIPDLEDNLEIKLEVNLKDGNLTIEYLEDAINEYEESDGEIDDDNAESNSDVVPIKMKTQDPHKSLTKRLKKILRKIIQVDKDGHMVIDDCGNTKYLDPEYVFKTLLQAGSKMIDSDDFHYVDENGVNHFPMLEELKIRYPWVQGIIDECDNDLSLASELYSRFHTDYASYWTTLTTDRGMAFYPINKGIGEETAYDAIVNNYEKGNVLEHAISIYSSSSMLNWDNINSDTTKKHLREIETVLQITEFADDPDRVKITIREHMMPLLKAVGIEVDNTIEDFLNYPQFDTIDVEEAGDSTKNTVRERIIQYNSYKAVVKNLKSIYDSLQKVEVDKRAEYEAGMTNLIDQFLTEYKQLSNIIGQVTEFSRSVTFRQGKEAYPSYSVPNYITYVLKSLLSSSKNQRTGQDRSEEIAKLYKKDAWFYNNKTGEWNCTWLDNLLNHQGLKESIKKDHNDGIIHVNMLNGIKYEDWTPQLIRESIFKIFFQSNTKNDNTYCYYNTPTLSDAPVMLMIKGIRYRNKPGMSYKQALEEEFIKVVKQEISRILLVKERKKQGITQIQNYDKFGENFYFFEEMNSMNTILSKKVMSAFYDYKYKDSPSIAEEKKAALSEQNKVTVKEALLILEYLKSVSGDITFTYEQDGIISDSINTILNDRFEEFKQSIEQDEVESLKSVFIKEGVIPISKQEDENETQKKVREESEQKAQFTDNEDQNAFDQALEEFHWNNTFATMQIIELATVDPAFYKHGDNGIDLQKRFKEIYAGGLKLNMSAQYGYREEISVTLKDIFQVSNTYDTLKDFINHRMLQGEITKMDVDLILHAFRNINQTDAQAFRTLDSYRAVMDMLGSWKPEFQEAFERIERNEWNMKDFQTIWQTLKPFLFGVIESPTGLKTKNEKGEEVDITHLVPIQHKNSEFLLLAAYPFYAAALKNSELYQGINEAMLELGIHKAQFESATKVGGQSPLDISYSKRTLHNFVTSDKILPGFTISISQVFQKFKDAVPKSETLSDIDIIKKGIELFLEKGTLKGQQAIEIKQYLQPSKEDIKEMFRDHFTITVNGEQEFNPNTVRKIPTKFYSQVSQTPEHLKDTDVIRGSQFTNIIVANLPDDFKCIHKGRLMTKQDLLQIYNQCFIENEVVGYKQVFEHFSNPKKLSNLLKNLIKGNPKYSKDMNYALSLNSEGEFNIPVDYPTMSNQIAELTLAYVKNHVTKQKMSGASCILATNIGLTDKLKMVLKDGKTYDGSQELTMETLSHAEVYMPASSRELYKDFLIEKTEGNVTYWELDIEKIEKECPEALKGIGIRIPTEAMYSIIPMRVVGFLPEQNGSAIMLPADITCLSGCDFDVDKLFIMLYSFKRKETVDTLSAVQGYKKATGLESVDLQDEEFQKWLEENKENYTKVTYEVDQYDYDKSPQEQTKEARDNATLDIAFSILNSPFGTRRLFTPGNYNDVTSETTRAAILTDKRLFHMFCLEYFKGKKYSIQDGIDALNSASKDTLLDFYNKHQKLNSISSFSTFIRNHQQNMIHAKLIGMFANNLSLQAKYQESGLRLKPNYSVNIDGHKFSDLSRVLSPEGKVIADACAQCVASAVDGGKDPQMHKVNMFPDIANFTGMMLRLGIPFRTIFTMLSLPQAKYWIQKTGSLKRFSSNIDYQRNWIIEEFGLNEKDLSNIEFNAGIEYSTEEMQHCIVKWNDIISAHYRSQQEGSNVQAPLKDSVIKTANTLIKYYNLLSQMFEYSQSLQIINTPSRADSVNGAVDISISKAINQVAKVNEMNAQLDNPKFPFEGFDNIIMSDIAGTGYDYIPSPEELRKKLFDKSNKVPRLQASYTLGIDYPLQILGQLFYVLGGEAQTAFSVIKHFSKFGTFTDKYNKAFEHDLKKFLLSKTKLFGDEIVDGKKVTFEEKRNFYLYEFPQLFIELLEQHPYLKDIPVISQIGVKRGTIRLQKSNRIFATTRNTFTINFNEMLYGNDPIQAQLAKDLFMYSYYSDGLFFGPNNYNNFMDSFFLQGFPEALGIFRNPHLSEKEWNNFIKQFIMQAYNQSLMVNVDVEATDQIEVPVGNTLQTKNWMHFDSEISPAQYITNKGYLYEFHGMSGEDKVLYNKVGIIENAFGARFNANLSAEELAALHFDEEKYENLRKLFMTSKRIQQLQDKQNKKEESSEKASIQGSYVSSAEGIQRAYTGVDIDYLEEHGGFDMDRLAVDNPALADAAENEEYDFPMNYRPLPEYAQQYADMVEAEDAAEQLDKYPEAETEAIRLAEGEEEMCVSKT